MNLYKVTCKGMDYVSASTCNVAHGVGYVVAKDPTSAYQKVREHLDKRDLGFEHERELKSIELVAAAEDYPDCGYRLYE